MTQTLPARPDLEWLKKAAKERLSILRARTPLAKLHQAQLALANVAAAIAGRAEKT